MEFIQNEQLRLLVQIQGKESRITEILDKQKKLPDIISSLKVSLDRAQSTLSEASQEFEGTTKERRRLEGLLQDSEEKVRKLKGRIPEIKTNKEYQALLKEIAIVEQEKSDFEEKIIMLLDKSDSLKAVCTEKENIVKKEEQDFLSEKGRIDADFDQLTVKLKELESERAAIESEIEPKLLAEYNKLISIRKGLAVVSVRNDYCLGCHIRVPPQIFTEIKNNDKIISCLSCQRILYWKPK